MRRLHGVKTIGMDMNKRRIMVAGGAGFLGSHLCESLIKMGNYVICVDNLVTGSKDNISPFLERENFEFIQHDITVPLHVEIEEIYNLACPASPIHYQMDPIKTIKTNILGSINLLDLARRTGARILQASTSEVYGTAQIHPQNELYWGNVNPIGVRSCYDEGKRSAETLFFDYHRQFGLEIKVARIFNTYGPKMLPDDGRVVSNFVLQALNNSPITIYGTGCQTRSFCYVDDLVRGIINLMHSSREVTGPVNLGNPIECSILELARIILKLTRSKSDIEFKPLPLDDPNRRKPDITVAMKELEWAPVVKLELGLSKTISHFRKVLRKPEPVINN